MHTLAQQLSDFNTFAAERLTSSLPPASLDDVIDEWYSLRTVEADLLAIEQSLEDFQRGERGRPVNDVLTELRDRELQRRQ